MKLAERMSRIGVEGAFEVLVRARALEAQGRDIIHLEIGEPDFDTPGAHRGSGQTGARRRLDALRTDARVARVARGDRARTSRARGASSVGPEHVSVVPGGKPIIFFPMLALLEPGDEVIYPDPGFPIYESMINFLGATPVPIPLVEERGFSFDLNLLRDKLSAKTKMLILELAAESDRRRDSGRRHPRYCRNAARSRSDGAVRRDLLGDLLWRAAAFDRHLFPACWKRPSSSTDFRKPTR